MVVGRIAAGTDRGRLAHTRRSGCPVRIGVDADRCRGGREVVRGGGDVGRWFGCATFGPAAGLVLADHGRRACVRHQVGHGRAEARCARGHHGRRCRGCHSSAAGVGAAGVHAVRSIVCHCRRRHDRWCRGIERLSTRSRSAGSPDAGVAGGVSSGCLGAAGGGRDGRVQAGRCPNSGASLGIRREHLHAHPARYHRRCARAGGTGPCTSLRVGGPRWRNTRTGRQRQTASVPGDDEPVRCRERARVAAAALFLRLSASRRICSTLHSKSVSQRSTRWHRAIGFRVPYGPTPTGRLPTSMLRSMPGTRESCSRP